MAKQLNGSGKVKATLLVLLALGCSISILVYFSVRVIDRPDAFFARSINDAAYDCEDKIKDRFEEQLLSKHYDQYSSRYDADDHQYLIYYRVSVREEDENVPITTDYMAKCVVWERFGYVSEFRVYIDD